MPWTRLLYRRGQYWLPQLKSRDPHQRERSLLSTARWYMVPLPLLHYSPKFCVQTVALALGGVGAKRLVILGSIYCGGYGVPS